MSVFTNIKDNIFAGQAAGPLDLEARLDEMASANGLGWRSSLIDFLRTIDVEHSYANRRVLAGELGLVRYQGTRDENLWILKAIMSELARTGAKVPATLLD